MTAAPRAATGAQGSGFWRRWLWQPRKVWLRRVFFQAHLWSGIGAGLYIFFISVTGSVLVYRNELYVALTPEPMIDPQTGVDNALARSSGLRLVTTLMALHDDLLAGATGRMVNGIGAITVLLVAATGLLLWWRGLGRWPRGLTLRRTVGWKRLVWDLHNALGFWSASFVLVFAASGVYLCFPDAFHALADRIQPPTPTTAGERLVDHVLYWLAFLHFGRIDGIGLPCSGPGLCDQAVKALWALFGLAPAALFATGATMWWNRVLRRAWQRHRSSPPMEAGAARGPRVALRPHQRGD